jgi:hypothetical protein
MKADPAWVLVSGFFLLGTLLAVVIGGGGFLFLSGYHAGLSQRLECPRPALSE